MSYDISLVDLKTRQPVEVKHHIEGGTHIIGGTTKADLNITYNYGECYNLCQFTIRDLYGKTGKETEAKLAEVVEFLGIRQFSNNYWAPTPGNAGYACSILLAWAREHPDAVWEGD